MVCSGIILRLFTRYGYERVTLRYGNSGPITIGVGLAPYGQFLPPDHKLAPKWAWPGVRDPISKLAGAGAYCGGHLAAQLVMHVNV